MDSFAKIKRIIELLVCKTSAEMIAAEVAKLPSQKIGEICSKLVAFKTIKNAIADIEADQITVSDEMIEELGNEKRR